MLLTLGFVVVALGLVAVVVDASAVFLARRGLASACDGASLAGAQSVDVAGVYGGAPTGTSLPLAQVQRAVGRYAAELAPGSALSASVSGGVRVVVVGTRQVDLPVSHLLGIGRIIVHARAEAISGRLVGPAP